MASYLKSLSTAILQKFSKSIRSHSFLGLGVETKKPIFTPYTRFFDDSRYVNKAKDDWKQKLNSYVRSSPDTNEKVQYRTVFKDSTQSLQVTQAFINANNKEKELGVCIEHFDKDQNKKSRCSINYKNLPKLLFDT